MSTPLVHLDEQARQVLRAELGAMWSGLLGLPSVELHQDFFQLGGNPELGAALLEKLKQRYQVSFPLAELYEARTISKLADLIEMRQSAREQLCVVPIQPRGYRAPLFLVHGVGGNILGFASLAKSLHADQPVYGIQAQALQSGGPTLINLEDMAKYYVEQVRRTQPSGPYALLGFSYGGLVAYEMAQQLAAAGERVRFLGMLDTWQPSYSKLAQAKQPRLQRIWARMYLVRMNTRKLSPVQMVPYAYIRLKSRILRIAYRRMASTGPVSLPDSMRKVRDINLMAGDRYRVRPYPGKVTLFRAKDDATLPLPDDLDWGTVAQGGVEIIRLPGDHGQILAEPNLSFMAAQLDTCLAPVLSQESSQGAAKAAHREEFELDAENLVRVDMERHTCPTAAETHEATRSA